MKIAAGFSLALGCGLAALRGADAAERPATGADTPPVVITYKTVENCPVRLTVYRATGDDVRPAVLWIHGGALILGSRSDLRPDQRDRYLAAGFVVVAIDYRLAPETKLPRIMEDVRDAYDWIRREGPARFRLDPDRIALVGHSAGGYLTLLSGMHLRPGPRALVSFYGYGDIAGAWANQPDPHYNESPPIARVDAYRAVAPHAVSEDLPRGRGRLYRHCRQQGTWAREVAGFDPAGDPARADPWCPVRGITRAHPPTLLLHGDADTDVPVEQSARMHAELTRHGVPCVFLRDPTWEHGFDGRLSDPGVAAAFDTVIAFLQSNLRPHAEAASNDR